MIRDVGNRECVGELCEVCVCGGGGEVCGGMCAGGRGESGRKPITFH